MSKYHCPADIDAAGRLFDLLVPGKVRKQDILNQLGLTEAQFGRAKEALRDELEEGSTVQGNIALIHCGPDPDSMEDRRTRYYALAVDDEYADEAFQVFEARRVRDALGQARACRIALAPMARAATKGKLTPEGKTLLDVYKGMDRAEVDLRDLAAYVDAQQAI